MICAARAIATASLSLPPYSPSQTNLLQPPVSSWANPKVFPLFSFAAIVTSPRPNLPLASSAPPPKTSSANSVFSVSSVPSMLNSFRTRSSLAYGHYIPSSHPRRRPSAGRTSSPCQTPNRRRGSARTRQRKYHHFFEKSIHPAHHTLLQLLHLPQGSRSARRTFHDPRRSPRARRARPPRRLQRSSLQPRRSTRKDFSRSPRIPPRSRLFAHARLSCRYVRTRPRENRPASSRQSRRHGPCGPRTSERFERQRRPDARKCQPAPHARWFAPRQSAGQSARAAPPHHRRSWQTQHRIHHRHSDRHRRNHGRTHRLSIRHSSAARKIRPHSGSHHPKFPRQAGYSHGRSSGAVSGRHAAHHRPRPPDPWTANERSSPAKPKLRGFPSSAGSGHQRLGRHFSCHERFHQSRGGVAADRAIANRNRSSRFHLARTPCALSRIHPSRRISLSSRPPSHRGSGRPRWIRARRRTRRPHLNSPCPQKVN